MLEQAGKLTVGAEVLDADVVQLGQAVGGLKRLERGFLDRVDLVGEGHVGVLSLKKKKGGH